MRLVPANEVLGIWEKAQPLIQKAIDTEAMPHLSFADVLNDLVTGNQQLWMGEDVVICTQIQVYPQCKSLVLTFCGGENMASWFAEAYAKIKAWAILMGCQEVLVVGRPGWEKCFPEFTKISIIMRVGLCQAE